MPTLKNNNKTENIIAHLKRYKRINRSTALQLYAVGNLPEFIRKIKKSRGLNIEVVKGSSPNTKYELKKEQ